jgi:hypothetical protein
MLPTPRSYARDKVSNGRLLPKSVDLRSAAGRRFRFLVERYSEELGREPTEAEKSMIRQRAAFQLHAEQMQAAIANGESVNSDTLIRINSELRRLSAAFEAAKVSKVSPDAPTELDRYLRDKYGPVEAEDDDEATP